MIGKPKKVILIGGGGYIGHNLAISLKVRGHNPVVIDNLAVNNILSFTDNDIKTENYTGQFKSKNGPTS